MACVSDSNSPNVQQMTSTEDKSESYSEEPLESWAEDQPVNSADHQQEIYVADNNENIELSKMFLVADLDLLLDSLMVQPTYVTVFPFCSPHAVLFYSPHLYSTLPATPISSGHLQSPAFNQSGSA